MILSIIKSEKLIWCVEFVYKLEYYKNYKKLWMVSQDFNIW